MAVENASQTKRRPRAAYVHVPFCAHHCGYCNFTVVAGREDLVPQYLQALERELSGLGDPLPTETLFVGGGTPSQLPWPDLHRFLKLLKQWLPLVDDAEFSVEANPADVTPELVACLAEHGVNRLSLGGQSFDAARLAILERDHDRETILRAVAAARPAIRSLSLDLIFAVPGQSAGEWEADLQAARQLPLDHLSTYGLTFEKGTTFWSRREKGELAEVEEERQRTMYALAIEQLTAGGFEHYEISNFAQPGHRCRHNETYWTGGSYAAFGPGAARFVAGRRETNHRSTVTWIKRVLAGESPVAESEALSAEDLARERAVFGMRRLEGLERDAFQKQTGFDLDQLVGPVIQKYVGAGLLDDDGERVRLSTAGLFVSDSLWPEFLGG